MAGKHLVFALLALILGSFLTGCGALAQRVSGAGATTSGTATPEVELEASLEPGEGIGGGALEPADIGTAIQMTVDAALTEAAPESEEAEASNTPAPPTASPTSAVTATVPGAQFTQLYQTLTAIAASSTPTPTIDTSTDESSTPTGTPDSAVSGSATPTPNGSPTPTPNLTQQAISARPCLALRFIADVTIPDGTPVQPSTTFFKSWYVQNIGRCRWTPDFKLVFQSGTALGAAPEYSLGTFVNPDQFVTLTAQMFAPASSGYYTSFWGLADESGTFFGWSADNGVTFDQPFYVQIYVLGSSTSGGGAGQSFPGVVSTAPPYTPVP